MAFPTNFDIFVAAVVNIGKVLLTMSLSLTEANLEVSCRTVTMRSLFW